MRKESVMATMFYIDENRIKHIKFVRKGNKFYGAKELFLYVLIRSKEKLRKKHKVIHSSEFNIKTRNPFQNFN